MTSTSTHGRFSLGYRPDPYDPRDRKAELLLGHVSAAPSSFTHVATLEGYLQPKDILDQQTASSCVAHSGSQASRTTCRIAGFADAPLPNILAGYREARAASGDEDRDAGTYPRAYYQALRTYGYAREDVWPFDPRKVLDKIPPKVFQNSYDQVGKIDYYRVSESPDKRKAQIMAAIDQKKVGTLAFQVDDAFEQLSSSGLWVPRGTVLGGHNLMYCGYSDQGVRIVNSWGTGWADGGLGWVSWAAVLDPSRCTDVYVINAAPRISG